MESKNEFHFEEILIGAMEGNTQSIVQLIIIALALAFTFKIIQMIYKRGELLFKAIFLLGFGLIIYGFWKFPDRVLGWFTQLSDKINELIMSIS